MQFRAFLLLHMLCIVHYLPMVLGLFWMQFRALLLLHMLRIAHYLPPRPPSD
jgi:hypothetical protein